MGRIKIGKHGEGKVMAESATTTKLKVERQIRDATEIRKGEVAAVTEMNLSVKIKAKSTKKATRGKGN